MAPLGKQTLNPSHIFYTPCSGIWQSVWLESAPAEHISRLDVAANMDGEGAFSSTSPFYPLLTVRSYRNGPQRVRQGRLCRHQGPKWRRGDRLSLRDRKPGILIHRRRRQGLVSRHTKLVQPHRHPRQGQGVQLHGVPHRLQGHDQRHRAPSPQRRIHIRLWHP